MNDHTEIKKRSLANIVGDCESLSYTAEKLIDKIEAALHGPPPQVETLPKDKHGPGILGQCNRLHTSLQTMCSQLSIIVADVNQHDQEP